MRRSRPRASARSPPRRARATGTTPQLRGGRVDAAREQLAAPGGVSVAVAVGRVGVVLHAVAAEEDGQQPRHAHDVGTAEPAARADRVAQPVGKQLGRSRQARVGALVEQAQRREAGGDGERVPRQRAGLVDVAGGRDPLHQLAPPAVGRRGQPAADHLAHDRQVRDHAAALLRPARRDAEAGDDLVEDQQRAGVVGALAQQLQEAGLRGDEPHVRRVGLGDDRRQPVRARSRDERLRVVPRHHDRLLGGRLGHAGARRDPLRREAGAGVGEQAVDVAVIGAGELEDLVATRGCAREPQRAHRRLRAGRRHPHHLDRRDALHDLGGERDLAGRRGAIARAERRRLLHRTHDLRVRVTVDQRTPRADVVDVAVAVHVDQLAALAARDEQRVSADRAHRAHGRVDAAGQQLERACVQLCRADVLRRPRAHVPRP